MCMALRSPAGNASVLLARKMIDGLSGYEAGIDAPIVSASTDQ